jgi:hypothetical protein
MFMLEPQFLRSQRTQINSLEALIESRRMTLGREDSLRKSMAYAKPDDRDQAKITLAALSAI